VATFASRQGDVRQITVNLSVTKQFIPSDFLSINYSAVWEPAEDSAASAKALIRHVWFSRGTPAALYNWQKVEKPLSA
jgi:hypothetical protein